MVRSRFGLFYQNLVIEMKSNYSHSNILPPQFYRPVMALEKIRYYFTRDSCRVLFKSIIFILSWFCFLLRSSVKGLRSASLSASPLIFVSNFGNLLFYNFTIVSSVWSLISVQYSLTQRSITLNSITGLETATAAGPLLPLVSLTGLEPTEKFVLWTLIWFEIFLDSINSLNCFISFRTLSICLIFPMTQFRMSLAVVHTSLHGVT